MQLISHKITTCYEYNGKLYKVSNRKNFRINDIFIDGRDYGIKIIEDAQDILDLAYMASELYVILEEVTTQN